VSIEQIAKTNVQSGHDHHRMWSTSLICYMRFRLSPDSEKGCSGIGDDARELEVPRNHLVEHICVAGNTSRLARIKDKEDASNK